MNNFKKIGLTALAASLVSVSANAGELTATGTASISVDGYSGSGGAMGANDWGMNNSINFNGSTELDNGLTVSMHFELDQGASNNSSNGFDNHSVTISSDAMGTVKFSGHGGSSATGNIAGTAAGSIYDNFDGEAKKIGAATIADALGDNGGGNNSFLYTSPELMDGLNFTGSFNPAGDAGVNSMVGLGVNYTGVEGLSVSYATLNIEGHLTTEEGDETAMKASYAYGPVTVAYSNFHTEIGASTASTDMESTAYGITYTVSDGLSVTYGSEEHDRGDTSVDAEYDGFTAAYTAGGMTLSVKMQEGENTNFTTNAGEDIEWFELAASFAF